MVSILFFCIFCRYKGDDDEEGYEELESEVPALDLDSPLQGKQPLGCMNFTFNAMCLSD